MAGKTRTTKDWEMSRIVGEQIYCRRMDRGLSQRKLARIVGCSQSTVGEIENGDRVANSNTLYRIARALSCDVGYFFGPIRAAESVTF